MFFHYLPLALLLTTLHISSTAADTLSRLSCDCAANTMQGYDLHYHSNRLHTSYTFSEMKKDYDKHKFDEMCWKPPGHEFCYNRNLLGRDQVRLDSKKKTTLPSKNKKDFPVGDCTEQCRRWFGQESSCNTTGGYYRAAPDGTQVWESTMMIVCSGRKWEFEDL